MNFSCCIFDSHPLHFITNREREENPDLQVTLVLTVLTVVMELTVFLVWTVAMVQMEKRDHQGQSDPKVNP